MLRSALLGCLLAFSTLACSEEATPGGGGSGVSGNAPGDTGGGGQVTSPAGASGSSAGRASGGAPASAGFSASGATSNAGRSGNVGASGDGGSAQIGGSGGALAGSGGVGGSANTDGGSAQAGGSGGTFTPVPVEDLPSIDEMPDPLTMIDGTKVTTQEQWRARRAEMIQILEEYEYGHMPPPPGNVRATVATESRRLSVSGGLEADYRMLHLTFGPAESLGFDLGLFTPADVDGPFPVLITLTSSANQSSLGSASAAFQRGWAIATVPYQELGADAANWQSTGFFSAYPDYDWRDFSAWAWGISRAVDYLVTEPAVDPGKIMTTGASRLGQAVLLAGAFDERIAVSAPVAGGMAFRFSGKEMGGGLGQGITEIVDQNTYWFGPRLPEFRNQTPKLPSDQHWLLALTAPRLFIMANSLEDQYGRAYAAVQTYLEAKPVYEFLGVTGNVGLHFRPGGHGMNAEDWSAVLDFADQYLLMKGGDRRFDEIPPENQLP